MKYGDVPYIVPLLHGRGYSHCVRLHFVCSVYRVASQMLLWRRAEPDGCMCVCGYVRVLGKYEQKPKCTEN